ncbi:MAG TPA: NAD(+)/NADH kinase [Acidimicrobiales bacterium]|nr:NAD(+)/NADH kinase [Acidimicrobiales bacterium]
MSQFGTLGVVVHPLRPVTGALDAITTWAHAHDVTVLGLTSEVSRLECLAQGVSEAELADRADLVVALGGDGTMLRALRLVQGRSTPVLGVNLGKLGFLAEVDVADLVPALTAMGEARFSVEERGALEIQVEGQIFTAFNDVVLVRVPGRGTADVELSVQGRHFVSYAADAIIVATPTGSTAYSFSAGGPIIEPSVAALIVTPAAPHSVFNRAIVIDPRHSLSLGVLPSAVELAVEVDGNVVRHVGPNSTVEVSFHHRAAHVVRLGGTTFYERARRKLGITGSQELTPSP